MARYLLLEEAVGDVGRSPIAALLLLQLFDRTHLLGVDDEIAQLGIEGAAAPFRTTATAGEARDLGITRQWRERHAVMQMMGGDQLLAEIMQLRRDGGHVC